MRTRIVAPALVTAILVSSTAIAQPAPSPAPAPVPVGPAPAAPLPPTQPQPTQAQPVQPQPAQLQPVQPQPGQLQPGQPQPPPMLPVQPAQPAFPPQGPSLPGAPFQGPGLPPGFGPQVRFADDSDLARLDHILHHHATNGRYYGIAIGVSGLVTGGVAIPVGVHMLNKADNPIPGAITLGIGIGSAVGGIISFFVTSSDLDGLARSLEDKKEAGEPAALIVPEIEQEWREKARSTKTARTAFGVVGVALGAVAMGVGTGFAVAEPIGDIDRTEQQALGAALIGVGATTVLTGFAQVFLETPIESTWDVYSSFKTPSLPPMMIQRPTVGFVPLRSPSTTSALPFQGGAITLGGALW